MGYFDAVSGVVFKKDATGRALFYPWGARGSGFVIESDAQQIKFRRFCKMQSIISLMTIVIVQSVVGFWLNLVLLPIYFAWYYFTVKKMTQGLVPAGERLTVAQTSTSSQWF